MSITIQGPEYGIIQVNNEFIDKYMVSANGEYVKVYLMLLRHTSTTFTQELIETVADKLQCTEKDVTRALNYWIKVGVISEMPEKSKKSDNESANSELKQILFVATQYLGKTLELSEVNTIYYIYNDLEFSSELIEYLLEYCVEKDKRNMQYIKTVAVAWHKKGITTVQEAKESSNPYYSACYKVMSSLGISGRNPVPSEVDYCEKWMKEYGFSLEIIIEACRRTLDATHKPSFDYCNGILQRWFKKDIKTLDQIKRLDLLHEERKKTAAKTTKSTVATPISKRDYDYVNLEKALIN